MWISAQGSNTAAKMAECFVFSEELIRLEVLCSHCFPLLEARHQV